MQKWLEQARFYKLKNKKWQDPLYNLGQQNMKKATK
jgi:hypothetical protein